MAFENLNDVYSNGELYYWCNACGDINVPGEHPLHCGAVDDLPIRERNLYENYWGEGCGCCMYVVTCHGQPAMALGFLFDRGWCAELMGCEEDKVDMERFWQAVKDCAGILAHSRRLAGCDVLAGKNTDPDGHEILVTIPYDMRCVIEDLAKWLDCTVYESVAALL